MAGTINQIAELAGVSRGTVDRALNGRGRVNAEVADKIMKIADELGYVPKHRGGRMEDAQPVGMVQPSGMKKKIGIITQLAGSSFMIEVNKGVEDSRKELESRGVEVILRSNAAVNEAEQLHAIEELLEEGIDGLAIMPTDSDGVRRKLNELSEQEIPIVTFNSDIVGTKRCCFVGLNNQQSGKTAAGLMGLLMRGRGKVLVITGYFSNSVSNRRVDGFVNELKNSFPEMELTGVQSSFDQAEEVERIIIQAMTSFPDLEGIFVASGGQAGVRHAFEKLQLKTRPYVIIYDLTPRNVQALTEGTVDFLIDQEGYEQGYRAPLLLADLVTKGVKPEKEFMYTEINIKTKYNL